MTVHGLAVVPAAPPGRVRPQCQCGIVTWWPTGGGRRDGRAYLRHSGSPSSCLRDSESVLVMVAAQHLQVAQVVLRNIDEYWKWLVILMNIDTY